MLMKSVTFVHLTGSIMMMSPVLVVAVLAGIATSAPLDLVSDESHGRVVRLQGGESGDRGVWGAERRAVPDNEAVTLTLYLKQNNLSLLEKKVEEISDPESPTWRQFMSKAEVDEMVGAGDEAVKAVTGWLRTTLGTNAMISSTSDTVTVRTGAAEGGSLLKTSFVSYRHKRTGITRTSFGGSVHVPVAVSAFVDFISGGELWEGAPKPRPHKGMPAARAKAGGAQEDDEIDLDVTPALLRQKYGIPPTEVNTAPSNLQSVVAFDDFYSSEALDKFYENTTLGGGSAKLPTLTNVGIDCLVKYDKKACDQVESDLDVQYLTALGAGVDTMFHGTNTSDGWVLRFSQNALELDPLPKVFTVSYGWAELKQCDIAILECDKLGYDASKYVNRTNVNFQRLAAMGATIFVSDGDDGAQGVNPSGENPLDMDHWCPDKWSCYPYGFDKPKSQCGAVTIQHTTTGDTCTWPVGMNSDHCQWLYLTDFYQDEVIVKAIKDGSPNCDVQSFIDGSYNSHLYSKCGCNELMATHKDITLVPFAFNASARIFFADFPTASPWVTSVGATRFKSKDGKTVSDEIGASIKDGAIITTGGGFSELAAQPVWQKAAVTTWSSSDPSVLPPKGTYSTTGRGYPDITLNGHNYQVVYANDGGTSCPCTIGGVDGTSASSPAVAGMFSLINGHLLAAGSAQLGFLNPLLYRLQATSPDVFSDIVSGDNKCTRDYCMEYGYSAVEGWDPVTGLGAPVYTKMKAAILALDARSRAAH